MTVAWKRFPIPAFDHRALKGLTYEPAPVIAADKAASIAAKALAGDASVAGPYAVEPDAGLLERLNFEGDYRQMFLCALPGPGARLLGRSFAWFNQRLLVLDANAADATILHDWHTPRTHNTRLGPDDGVTLDSSVVWLLSGRIVEGGIRGNRLMPDGDWTPEDGRAGYRIAASCDRGGDNFHDTCAELSWAV